MKKILSFLVTMMVVGLASVAQANDYTHEAYVSPDGYEESYHGKETRQTIGGGIGQLIVQIISIPGDIVRAVSAKEDGGAEYDYHREGGVTHSRYRNYPSDPQGALPSGGYGGYPPVNNRVGYSTGMYVPGSNIPLGFTPVPASQIRANFGSRGWGVRMGN